MEISLISLGSLRKATPQRNQDGRFRARTFSVQEEFPFIINIIIIIIYFFFQTRLCEPSDDEARIAAGEEEMPQANPLARNHSSTISAHRAGATQQGIPTHTEVSPN